MQRKDGRTTSAVDDQDLNALNSIFARIANLLALSLIKDEKQENQIVTLSAAGYTPTEIAKLIGTTSNTVRVTLSTSKAKAKKKTGKKRP